MSVQAISWALTKVNGVKPIQKLILICLANHAGPDGSCWPSQSTIEEYSGVTRETVNRTLSDLEKEGWLRSVRRKDSSGRDLSKIYTLNLVKESYLESKKLGVTENHTGVIFDHRGCDGASQGGCDVRSHPGVTVRHTKQQHEPSFIEPSKETTSGDVVIFSKSVEKKEDSKSERSSGEKVGDPLPGESLLLEAGITPPQATKLAREYPLDRIQAVVSAGAGKKAGWIFKALTEAWPLPEIKSSDVHPGYRDDLKIWHDLPQSIRSRFIKDRGFGVDFDFPEAAWLREKLEILGKKRA